MTVNAYEIVYGHALTAIAQGASRAEVRAWIARHYGSQRLNPGELETCFTEALDGALSCGVEREDIDPSWL